MILKVVTLLSATVDIEDYKVIGNDDGKEEGNNGDGGGEGNSNGNDIAGSVSAMAISNENNTPTTTAAATTTTNDKNDGKKMGRRVTLHFDTMGCILGGAAVVAKEEEDGNNAKEKKEGDKEEDSNMLITMPDGTRVIDMGTEYYNTNDNAQQMMTMDQLQLEEDLSRPFALPSPARESLLSVALLLLSKKGPLRSVSNTALFLSCSSGDNKGGVSTAAATSIPTTSNGDQRYMLILHWRALLRMLLRTAPYLDEHKAGTPPMSSSTRQSIVLKRTVTLIRSSRRFFDQGIRPPGWTPSSSSSTLSAEEGLLFPSPQKDATSRAIWDNVKNDLLYHTHSNSCYRALILLYLFHPSRCSSTFYLEVMPLWMESWSSVDRNPEFDFLWMVMFCRARKNIPPGEYDWGSLRRHLLTQCGYW